MIKTIQVMMSVITAVKWATRNSIVLTKLVWKSVFYAIKKIINEPLVLLMMISVSIVRRLAIKSSNAKGLIHVIIAEKPDIKN
jgi:hypothetical protein